MEVLNFNELDFSELKELAGGEEFTYSGGCGLWNGKCDKNGGCGLVNGTCSSGVNPS